MTDDDEGRILRFDGRLTLPEAEAIRSRLLGALQNDAPGLTVDCSEASEIDLSFIQILLAARRTAAAKGKSIALSAPVGGTLLEALERGGFVCRADAQDSSEDAFWTAAS